MLSSELVRSVLDSTPDALIIIDAGGRILFANRQVQSLFGHEPAAIVGCEVEVLLPERFRGRHTHHRDAYFQNVRVRPMGAGLTLYGARRDGSEFPVEISLSPIGPPGDHLVAAAIRDVTERKKTEQALEDARREAERANIAKSRFLATASHDLRQPLQALGLLNGALRRMVHDPESLDVLRDQDQAIDAMSRLLNALLDISKLESGAIKPDISDFDVAPMCEELRRDFLNVASSKGLQLAIESPHLFAHTDAVLMGQLLRNLLSNAIKYTQQGTVSLHFIPHDLQLRVEVRDTGVGIPQEQQAMIFEEFYQVSVSPNSSRDGYGLGLSIVQRIARLLQIRIEVSSTPGQGSVFSIELPAANAAGGNPATSARPAPGVASGSGRRILLVEDEPGVRTAMRMLLRIEGYDVIAVARFDEAAAQLKAGIFDLLVTDYHLDGGRTGAQVIDAARTIFGRQFGAVLVTGDTSSAIRDLRADPMLRITSKPINSDELLMLVRSLLAD